MNWKYILNGQTFGPVELSTLQTFIDNGTLSRETLVQREGTTDWIPARTVTELRFAERPPANTGGGGPIPAQIPDSSSSDADDVEKNKVFAILAYIGLLFLVPLLAAPNSKFARYHANQGIVLFLSAVISMFGTGILMIIPFIGCVFYLVMLAVAVGAVVLMVLGIVNAAAGLYKPLPLIGHFQILK